VRPDKNTLGGVLDVVAQQTRDSFTLHRHLYATDVRQDWPLYTDNDRRVLARYSPSLTLRFTTCAQLYLLLITRWRGSATGRALDLRSVGCGFKSYSRQRCVTTLGKLFTPMCSVTKQYNLVPAKGGDALQLGR